MDTTDPPNRDVSVLDPAETWITLAVEAHNAMHEDIQRTAATTRRRTECIQMAIAMGATQQQVADRLGISREQVSKLNSKP